MFQCEVGVRQGENLNLSPLVFYFHLTDLNLSLTNKKDIKHPEMTYKKAQINAMGEYCEIWKLFIN